MRLLNGLVSKRKTEFVKQISINAQLVPLAEANTEKLLTINNTISDDRLDCFLHKPTDSEDDKDAHLHELFTDEGGENVNEVSHNAMTNITEPVPTISQTCDSDWLLVEDGPSKFYFNKITKECSFEPQVIRSGVVSNDERKHSKKDGPVEALSTRTDYVVLIEWQLRKKNSVMIDKVEDFEIHMDFQLNKPFYFNVILFIISLLLPLIRYFP